jgi:hypothetical protein
MSVLNLVDSPQPWPATFGGSLYDEGSLQFTVTSASAHTALPGDFNGDDVFDAADYIMWRKFGGESEGYKACRGHFGESTKAVPSAIIPEPATLVLLMGAAAGWCNRRRQHS